MFKLFGKIFCILAMISLINGFDVIFQTYAWTTMLVDRAPQQGIEQAIDSTFSGEAPCPKCIALKKAKQDKEKHDNHERVTKRETLSQLVPCQGTDIILVKPSFQRIRYTADDTVGFCSIVLNIDTPPPDFIS